MTDETVFLDVLVKGIHQARAALGSEEGVEMYCPRCGEHTRVTYPEAVAFFLAGTYFHCSYCDVVWQIRFDYWEVT